MSEQPRATVLHVRVVTGAGGGPDKTILRSPRYMRERGYEELCAYLRPPADPGFDVLEQHARAHEAEIVALDDRGPLDASVVRQLVALCRRRRVRVWHGHDYKSNALGLLVQRFHRMKLLTTVHGWVHHTRRTPLYYFVDRCCLRWYERVLCVSRDLEATCLKAGVRKQRCRVLENGIELDQFVRRRSPAEARAALGLAPQVPLIGAVGRLAPEKNFTGLLRAMKQAQDAGAAFQATIIGDGSQRAELLALRDSLGLDNAVHFPGHCDDVRLWFEAMDLFVLSSLREAMPNVVLEAMAMRTPVVATRIAGVPDMIADGVAGILVGAGEVGELAAAIGELLAKPVMRDAFAAMAYDTVSRRYGFDQRMDRMQAIYDELLEPGLRQAG